MNHHFRVLQDRLQSHPVGACEDLHHAVGAGRAEHAEGIRHEVVQRQEEKLHARENYSDVGHQFRMLSAIGEQNREHVNRKQEAPKKERAFLSGPEGRNLVERRKVAVTVRRHVGDGVVVREKQVD